MYLHHFLDESTLGDVGGRSILLLGLFWKKRSHLQFLEWFYDKAPKPEYPSLNFSWFAKIFPQW